MQSKSTRQDYSLVEVSGDERSENPSSKFIPSTHVLDEFDPTRMNFEDFEISSKHDQKETSIIRSYFYIQKKLKGSGESMSACAIDNLKKELISKTTECNNLRENFKLEVRNHKKTQTELLLLKGSKKLDEKLANKPNIE